MDTRFFSIRNSVSIVSLIRPLYESFCGKNEENEKTDKTLYYPLYNHLKKVSMDKNEEHEKREKRVTKLDSIPHLLRVSKDKKEENEKSDKTQSLLSISNIPCSAVCCGSHSYGMYPFSSGVE